MSGPKRLGPICEKSDDIIARDSSQYAARMVDRIRAAVEDMSLNPDGEHWLPEIEARDIREIYVASYRIILSCERQLCSNPDGIARFS